MTWAYTTWTGLVQSSAAILCQLKNHTLHTCIPSWINLKGWPCVGSRHTVMCITAQTPWRQWNKRRFYSKKIDRSPGSFSGQIYSLFLYWITEKSPDETQSMTKVLPTCIPINSTHEQDEFGLMSSHGYFTTTWPVSLERSVSRWHIPLLLLVFIMAYFLVIYCARARKRETFPKLPTKGRATPLGSAPQISLSNVSPIRKWHQFGPNLVSSITLRSSWMELEIDIKCQYCYLKIKF